MSEITLDIDTFLSRSEKLPVIDVRSPGEFEQAHIPGAINMPLFNNEQRSVIGTLYLQKGSAEAILKGLDYIRPRLTAFKELAWQIAPTGEALLHCWRGGMRSNSMAWLFNTIGIKTYILKGGYKSYRRYIHQFFSEPINNLVVIGGMTGSGKTDILEELERKGQQVVHLERLACHKGSVFGGIGMNPQPSTEQFENELFLKINSLDRHKPVYIEDESLSIGKVFIPRPVFEQMYSARFINIEMTLQRRISNLIKGYAGGNEELMIDAVQKIQKRIGLSNATEIIAMIRQKRYDCAAEKLLVYYDKLYGRSMALHHRQKMTNLVFNHEDVSAQAYKIINLNIQNGN